jgi:hypothetical protein
MVIVLSPGEFSNYFCGVFVLAVDGVIHGLHFLAGDFSGEFIGGELTSGAMQMEHWLTSLGTASWVISSNNSESDRRRPCGAAHCFDPGFTVCYS